MKYCSLALLFFISNLFTQIPKFESQGKLKCNGQQVSDISWPTSCVVDWDGDGLNDLLVGEFSPNKKVRFYRNEGSKTDPEFKSYAYLKAAGVDIALSGG